jgi:hypothetical protein
VLAPNPEPVTSMVVPPIEPISGYILTSFGVKTIVPIVAMLLVFE